MGMDKPYKIGVLQVQESSDLKLGSFELSIKKYD
jgi:hypothetical protein